MKLFAIGLIFGFVATIIAQHNRRLSPPSIVLVPWQRPTHHSISSGKRVTFLACLAFVLAGTAIALWTAQPDSTKGFEILLQPSKIKPTEGLRATMQLATAVVIGQPRAATVIAINPTPIPIKPPLEESATKNQVGLVWLIQGNYDAAETAFQEAIVADPSYYEPYNNLAFCLYERGEIASAIKRWEAALSLYEQSADASAGLATALWMVGRMEESMAWYQYALSIDRRYTDSVWMQEQRHWSNKMLEHSKLLRAQLHAEN